MTGRGGILAAACLVVLSTLGCDSKPAVDLPDTKTAAALFEQLHGGIYRAFEQREEGAIYDSLADSVSGDLLDAIYGQVYESLIAREHGNVVSDIVDVRLVEVTITEPAHLDEEYGPTFQARAVWEVNSIAEHEQHTHLRSNQYEALYRVAYRPEGWRIVQDRVLRQRRLGDDWTPKAGANPEVES